MRSDSFLKALIVHAHPQNPQTLLRFLSTSKQETLKHLPLSLPVDFSSLLSLKAWVKTIHYSWFVAPLQDLPPETQSLFVFLFPKEHQKEFQERLQNIVSLDSLPEFVQLFLLEFLKKKIVKEDILSPYELPSSPLNALLLLAKAQLVHLADLLGIHDLAAELRQIVDRTLLGKIHAALTQEQLRFLHYCLKQPMKWPPPKLNIGNWDGNKRTLNRLLHQRGLFRLAQALVEENPSLQWHLCHKLDTGRASILMKLFAGKQERAMISYFKNQVIHLVKRYQKK